MKCIPAILLPAALLAGCAASTKPTTEKERVFLTDASKFTWTGRTLDEVIRVFGRPSSRAQDGTGNTVLTYDEIKAVGNTPAKPGVRRLVRILTSSSATSGRTRLLRTA